MNSSLQDKLSEVVGSNNIAYILNENTSFSTTGYKVMQNHSGSGLLKCAKLSYNGKIKLVYIVGNLKPLSFVATRLGVNELNAVVFNLIQRALEIKSNGFFCAENLEFDFDKIFVDTSDYSVYFIYFPVSNSPNVQMSNFENEFRIAIINLFNSFPVFNAPQFQRLCSDLSNGSLPLEQISKKLQNSINGNDFNSKIYEDSPKNSSKLSSPHGLKSDEEHYGYRPLSKNPFPQPNSQPPITITAINTPMNISLVINKSEYLIGKNPDAVDGAVTHNPAISRVHCKVSFNGGRYFITDMGSANGTYVNQNRLGKQQTTEIKNGDYLRLANSDFIISF